MKITTLLENTVLNDNLIKKQLFNRPISNQIILKIYISTNTSFVI